MQHFRVILSIPFKEAECLFLVRQGCANWARMEGIDWALPPDWTARVTLSCDGSDVTINLPPEVHRFLRPTPDQIVRATYNV